MDNLINTAITDPTTIELVASELRRTKLDAYFLYEIALHTGKPVEPLLNLTVKDFEEYMAKISSQLPKDLLFDLKDFLSYKNPGDFAFTSTRSNKKHLSKRTIQQSIPLACEKVGVKPFGIRAVQKTYLYNLFKKYNFDYKVVNTMARKQNHYFGSREAFLEYLGITEKDVKKAVTEKDIPNQLYDTILIECEEIKKGINAFKKGMSVEILADPEGKTEVLDTLNAIKLLLKALRTTTHV